MCGGTPHQRMLVFLDDGTQFEVWENPLEADDDAYEDIICAAEEELSDPWFREYADYREEEFSWDGRT